MDIRCPQCSSTVGFLANAADADAHYPRGCPFCTGKTASASTREAYYNKRQETRITWVDKDWKPLRATSIMEGGGTP